MSVFQELVSHDQVFSTLTTPPVIVNDFDVTTIDQKKELNRLLVTKYEGDALDITPSCDCGDIKGEYNVGMSCHICGTRCESPIDRTIESLLWIKAPEGIRALMNPAVWTILTSYMTIPGCNMLEWLCNPNYKPVGRPHDKLNRLVQLNIPRGYNYFVENFESIIQELIDKRIIRDLKGPRNDLTVFIEENRGSLFSQYLPIPSRVGFITEETAMGRYADLTMIPAIDAVRTISSINSSPTPLSQRSKETRVVNAIVKLAMFYRNFTQKTLGKKHGLLRKHVYGGRAHFTARAVITSLSEPHNYEELHVPWGMAVALFKLHLTSKMLRLGMTPIEIDRHITEHTLKYSPLIDQLFKEIIAESPYMGVPVIFQRNPTLARASAQRLYITRVKSEDVTVNTVSLSVLCLKGPNADFDGDELNMLLILDDHMHTHLSRLAPHLSVLDTRKPRSISRNIQLPPPVLVTISNWMHDGR